MTRARNTPLPNDFAERLRHLYETADNWEPGGLDETLSNAHAAGWTQVALANALGLTRAAVSARIIRWRQCNPPAVPDGIPAPPLSAKSFPPKWGSSQQARRVRTLDADVAADLRKLAAVARSVNGGTSVDDPRRAATIELSQRLADLRAEGFGYRVLAEATGVQVNSIRARLKSHGHLPQSPSQRSYAGRKTTGPSGSRADGKCIHGHELIGQNVMPNGTCRTCDTRRVNEYQARRHAQRYSGFYGDDKLGSRVENLLSRVGISSEQAAAMSDAELAALNGLGARGVARIREAIARGGLRQAFTSATAEDPE